MGRSQLGLAPGVLYSVIIKRHCHNIGNSPTHQELS